MFEPQHANGQRSRAPAPTEHSSPSAQREHVYRARDVPDRVLAQVLELRLHLARHLIAYRARQRDAAGLGQRLQARGHVDAVAVDVVTLDDDLAEVDPIRTDAIGRGERLRRSFVDCARVDRRDDACDLTNAPCPSADGAPPRGDADRRWHCGSPSAGPACPPRRAP
jgi:hypothetical protein